jgi:hypothetical protein
VLGGGWGELWTLGSDEEDLIVARAANRFTIVRTISSHFQNYEVLEEIFCAESFYVSQPLGLGCVALAGTFIEALGKCSSDKQNKLRGP